MTAMAPDALARPLISVVAPVYNEDATLREFVRRLIEVSNSLDHLYDFEFILVDDGSTDDSLRVARSLLEANRGFAWSNCAAILVKPPHCRPA